MASKLYDVLIIGGGPAGVSLATSVARQVYSALVIDSGSYRNGNTKHMHNVPGWDHVDPAELRAKARADLRKRYESIDFADVSIDRVRKCADGTFDAVGKEEGQVYRGKKLGLATGVRDMVELEASGYEACFGKGIFHCMYCHGFEERGVSSAGVLATGFILAPPMIAHVAPLAKRLAQHVVIYTNNQPELQPAIATQLHSSKISYDDRKIASYELVGGGPRVKIIFEDGTSKVEGFIASHPKVEQRAPFAEQLGLEMTETGEIKVAAPFGATSVPGVYAAGDSTTMYRAVLQAMQSGSFAGGGICGELAHDLDAKDEL